MCTCRHPGEGNVVVVHGKHDCCNNSLQALRKQCQNFATALLDHTRSSGELGETQLNIDLILFYIYHWYMQYTYYILQMDVSFCRNFAQPRPGRTHVSGFGHKDLKKFTLALYLDIWGFRHWTDRKTFNIKYFNSWNWKLDLSDHFCSTERECTWTAWNWR